MGSRRISNATNEKIITLMSIGKTATLRDGVESVKTTIRKGRN
jgi:hypothetical protein